MPRNNPLQLTWELLVIANTYFLFSQGSLRLEDIYILALVSEVEYGIDEQKILFEGVKTLSFQLDFVLMNRLLNTNSQMGKSL